MEKDFLKENIECAKREKEENLFWTVPEYSINSSGEMMTLSDSIPEYVKRLGLDYKTIKKVTGNGTWADGSKIKVGVCDTGIDRAHIESELVNVVGKVDYTGSRSGPYDRNSHGTWCLGSIGAQADGNGIEGVASDVALYSAKVLGDDGSGAVTWIASGIDWCVAQGCNIISLSLGGGYSQVIELALQRAARAGVIVVAAMGNSGNQGDGHPGNSNYTYGITAIDYNDRVAGFSSRSNKAYSCEYGVNTLGPIANGRWGRLSGTSMSTPILAGKLALVLGYLDRAGIKVKNMSELSDIILPAMKDLGRAGWDREYGNGHMLVESVISQNPITNPNPDPDPDPDPVDPQPDPDVKVKIDVSVSMDKATGKLIVDGGFLPPGEYEF